MQVRILVFGSGRLMGGNNINLGTQSKWNSHSRWNTHQRLIFLGHIGRPKVEIPMAMPTTMAAGVCYYHGETHQLYVYSIVNFDQ